MSGARCSNVLAERQFPLDEVAAVASPRSTGDIIDFGDTGKELKVQNIEHFDFDGLGHRPVRRRLGGQPGSTPRAPPRRAAR